MPPPNDDGEARTPAAGDNPAAAGGESRGRGVRAAVVGLGHLGSAHARVYNTLAGSGNHVELVAVADTRFADADESSRAEAETGARAVADYRDIPDDVEAVSVVVPTVLHREVAELFLARGASVLVEKPMAPSAAEAGSLLESASKATGLLQVGHIERFNPAVRAARAHMDRPRFIECRRVAPFSFRSKDIGVVFDLMIHDLDIIRWLVGEPCVRVDAVGTPVLLEHEDVANARLVFEGKDGEPGCVADLTASRVAAKAERALRIFQKSSYVSIDTGRPAARVFRPTGKLARGEIDVSGISPASLRSSDTDPREFLFKELIEVEELELPPESPLEAELASFINSVRTGSPPAVTAQEGLDAIRLAERVLEGIRRTASA